MNVHSLSFHAPKPGHLSLGELMDGGVELREHFVVRELANHKLRKKFVFQTVINQLIGSNSAIEQRFYFGNHPLVEALFEACHHQ